ncbi:558_t:CDS:2 [Gigaspora rosea]|nr:558_t:CDS:2 [Gigaspora rosea]
MSRARTSNEIWWARIVDRVDELLHNYPKLPKKPLPENSDNKTGNVYIIGMTSLVHELVVTRLQAYFRAPNSGVDDHPPIYVTGQPFHYNPDGSGVQIAPDVAVYPNITFVPKPALSTVIPPPPSDKAGNPHARIICEVGVGQSVGYLKQKCESWMREQYVRAVVSIKILKPRSGIREPATGYFYRTMTAKLYRQGIATQRWDFGNVKKNSTDPIRDPAPCNAPNLAHFQINIPVGEVFWNPRFPVPPDYAPTVPPVVTVPNFTIDLYRIQREALIAES